MFRVVGVLGCLATISAGYPAFGADLAKVAPVPFSSFNWAGWYVGGHLGYLDGRSDWASRSPNGFVTGATNLTNGFDLFKGSGSFFGGFQGGYNFVLPGHVLLGIEADASFPNLVSGTGSGVTNAAAASYGDTVLHSGTVRGRLGYVLSNNWLVYGTAGFAWSYDQLARTQLTAGALPAGAEENAFLWRFGWTAGAGVEIPVAPGWSARAEYLYKDFGNADSHFAASSEVFTSNLHTQEVRFGLNYKVSDNEGGSSSALIVKAPSAPTEDIWAVHGQTTFVTQYAAPFRAPIAARTV